VFRGTKTVLSRAEKDVRIVTEGHEEPDLREARALLQQL
jgi:hypothetical protein